jgi:hypothetical protein
VEEELSVAELELQDEIDNEVNNLLLNLAELAVGVEENDLPWNITAISKVRDVALNVLKEHYNTTLIYP